MHSLPLSICELILRKSEGQCCVRRALYSDGFFVPDLRGGLIRCVTSMRNLERLDIAYRPLSLNAISSCEPLWDHLPALQTLKVALDYTWSMDDAVCESELCRGPSGLKELDVEWITAFSPSGLFAFMTPSLPTLVSLTLKIQLTSSDCSRIKPVDPEKFCAPATASPSLTSLKIDLLSLYGRTFMIDVAAFEAICRSFPNLRELAYTWAASQLPWEVRLMTLCCRYSSITLLISGQI